VFGPLLLSVTEIHGRMASLMRPSFKSYCLVKILERTGLRSIGIW
jgi:hypothetical protein